MYKIAKNKSWQKRANLPIGSGSLIWGSLVYYPSIDIDSVFCFGGYVGSDMQDGVYQQRTHEQFGWQWIKVVLFFVLFCFLQDNDRNFQLDQKLQRKRASHRSFIHNDLG